MGEQAEVAIAGMGVEEAPRKLEAGEKLEEAVLANAAWVEPVVVGVHHGSAWV